MLFQLFKKIFPVQNQKKTFDSLPKIPQSELQVFVLVSHDMVDMTLYTLKNLLISLQRSIHITILERQDITSTDRKKISDTFNTIQFISEKKSLSCLPKAIHSASPFIYKLSVPLLTKSKKTLYLDPDVLFLQPAEFIVHWIQKGGNFFLKDIDDYYSFPRKKMGLHLSFPIVNRLNAGLLLFESQAVKTILLESVETYLQLFNSLSKLSTPKKFSDKPQWYIDQTVWAIVFSKLKGKALPEDYWLYARTGWNKEKLSKKTVAIHFSGPFKKKYWDFLSLMS